MELASPRLDQLGAIWSAAQRNGVAIRSFAPASRPLEEVFIETLRQAEQPSGTMPSDGLREPAGGVR
jgi:hypothetical protein